MKPYASIDQIIQKIETNPNFSPISSERQVAEFLQSLVVLASAKQVLEVGTYLGYATLHLLKGLGGNGNIYTIDETDYFSPYLARLQPNAKKRVVFLNQPSQVALPAMKRSLTFDVIFIDGDHAFLGCFFDFFQTVQHTKEGSMIVFHDALSRDHPGVGVTLTILRLVNLLFLTSLWEMVILPTPERKTGNRTASRYRDTVSGIALVRIKTNSSGLRVLLRGMLGTVWFIFYKGERLLWKTKRAWRAIRLGS